MKLTTRADVMTEQDRSDQRRHDGLHPGKVCQRCPTTIADQVADQINLERYRSRSDWAPIGFVIAALMLAAALLLFFA